MALEILNTAIRASRILILHPDSKVAEKIEAYFEQNGDFTGTQIYTAATLEEARGIARKHAVQTAIFPQYLEKCDFVTIQQELRNAQPSIEMIPLLATPSIAQLRESRNIGGVVDYGEFETISKPESLAELIFCHLREKTKESSSSKKAFEFVEPIQRALLVEHAAWVDIKKLSRSLVNPIIAAYDFSSEEVVSILAAEMIYVPWLQKEQYPNLIGSDPFHLAEALLGASSWVMPSQRPTSAAGLVITLTNYLSDKVTQGQPVSDIFLTITQGETRPECLKHPSIRTISESIVAQVAEVVEQKHGFPEKKLKIVG